MKEEKKPYLCPTAVVYTMAVEGGLLSGSDIIPEGSPGNNNEGGGGAGTTPEYGETFGAPGFGGFGSNDDRSSGGGSGGDIWYDIEEGF